MRNPRSHSAVRILVADGADVSAQRITISQAVLRKRKSLLGSQEQIARQIQAREHEAAARSAWVDLKRFCDERSIRFHNAKDLVAKVSHLIGIEPAWPKGKRPKARLMVRLARRLPREGTADV